MTKQYDLVAIGTGTGASGAAEICRKAGWKVAVVDNLPFGGSSEANVCSSRSILISSAGS